MKLGDVDNDLLFYYNDDQYPFDGLEVLLKDKGIELDDYVFSIMLLKNDDDRNAFYEIIEQFYNDVHNGIYNYMKDNDTYTIYNHFITINISFCGGECIFLGDRNNPPEYDEYEISDFKVKLEKKHPVFKKWLKKRVRNILSDFHKEVEEL